jgi:Zn finger protein HypA/HybF involved in hydrogenase expression
MAGRGSRGAQPATQHLSFQVYSTSHEYSYATIIINSYARDVQDDPVGKFTIKGVSVRSATHEKSSDAKTVFDQLKVFSESLTKKDRLLMEMIKLDIVCAKATVSIHSDLAKVHRCEVHGSQQRAREHP